MVREENHFIDEELTTTNAETIIRLPEYGLSLVAIAPVAENGTAVFPLENAKILNSFEFTR
jgi:hypothetical protein